jgi:hypothetical protein
MSHAILFWGVFFRLTLPWSPLLKMDRHQCSGEMQHAMPITDLCSVANAEMQVSVTHRQQHDWSGLCSIFSDKVEGSVALPIADQDATTLKIVVLASKFLRPHTSKHLHLQVDVEMGWTLATSKALRLACKQRVGVSATVGDVEVQQGQAAQLQDRHAPQLGVIGGDVHGQALQAGSSHAADEAVQPAHQATLQAQAQALHHLQTPVYTLC